MKTFVYLPRQHGFVSSDQPDIVPKSMSVKFSVRFSAHSPGFVLPRSAPVVSDKISMVLRDTASPT